MEDNKMVVRKDWEEFRQTGLFLLLNTFLHIFGWAICLETDEAGNLTKAFPARVKFRGFDEASTEEAYQRVSRYMVNEAQHLKDEAHA